MTMIFPGMDPYLEDPIRWPGVHTAILVQLHNDLNERLDSRYVAKLEERVYLEGPERIIVPDVHLQEAPSSAGSSASRLAAVAEPLDEPLHVTLDVLEVREPFLEIIDLQENKRVITVIELLSPANKSEGVGRIEYLRKQREILKSTANLVEIDLLRGGVHTVVAPEGKVRRLRPYHYLVSVNRAIGNRDDAEVYPIALREALPTIRIPLAAGDEDVRSSLDSALRQTYRSGRYFNRIDYSRPCVPPLSPADAEWAAKLVADAKGTNA